MTDVIRVEPVHPEKRTSKRVDPSREEATVSVGTARRNCFWNDEEYAPGTTIRTEDGAAYTCQFGYWEKHDDAT